MPTLRLFSANRLEALADALAEVVARPLGSPLESEIIVVRNPGMERWVTLALARRLGVWANSRFPLPTSFLNELFERCVGTESLEAWTPEILQWRVLRLLPSLLERPEFGPLRGYLEEDDRGLKRWQLAGRIADLIDQYMVYRPDWVETWRRGGEAGPAASPHREWQKVLLEALWAEGRGGDRVAVLRRFLSTLDEGCPEALPSRVSVFGISALPPLHLEALAALARCAEVNLFMLNPSPSYWFETETDRAYLRRQQALPARGASAGFAGELPSRTGSPLLASLGRLGGEAFRLLLDIEPKEEYQAFVPPEGESLLARLQRAIYEDSPLPSGEEEREEVSPEDESLQIHACYGPLREVEVLRDRLLALFDADASLRPEDIVVMAPDIETYVPYIEAVFRRGAEPWIPYNLSDRRLAQASPLARAFLGVLRLERLRFTAPAVLDILECEPVRAKFGIGEGDLASVRRWILGSGIRWGIDAADRERHGVPAREENTWRFGLRRLLLGTALEEGGVFRGVAPLAGWGGRETLEAFVRFAETLAQVVSRLVEPRSLVEWRGALAEALEALFVEGEETAALAREIAKLAEWAERSGYTEPVSLDVAAASLAARLEDCGPGLGFLTGGVTFCSLLPMRSIPFRVIALLGMGFGDFPRGSSPPGFDLMTVEPRIGDRSRRDDDRYLFLETIISARDVLYVSYVGRNPSDGSEMAPSVVVSELLEDISARFRLPYLLPLVHPLHRHSHRYFDGSDPRLYTYSVEAASVAASSQEVEARPRPRFVSAGLPEWQPEEGCLRLADLEEFFRMPARYWLRHRLGISLRETAEQIEAREPFAVEGLARYQIENELLERRLRGEPPDEVRRLLLARGSLPHGRQGEVELAAMEAELDHFVRRHEPVLRPRERRAVPLEVTAGGLRLSGAVELWDGRLVSVRYGVARAVDRLSLWIRHLAAVRAGLLERESLLLARDASVHLRPVQDTEALDRLVHLYCEGQKQPLRFFPETSLAFASARKRGGTEEEALRAARRQWLPSEHGRMRREAEDPSVRQCFADEEPFDESFRALALEVYGPMLDEEVP